MHARRSSVYAPTNEPPPWITDTLALQRTWSRHAAQHGDDEHACRRRRRPTTPLRRSATTRAPPVAGVGMSAAAGGAAAAGVTRCHINLVHS